MSIIIESCFLVCAHNSVKTCGTRNKFAGHLGKLTFRNLVRTFQSLERMFHDLEYTFQALKYKKINLLKKLLLWRWCRVCQHRGAGAEGRSGNGYQPCRKWRGRSR